MARPLSDQDLLALADALAAGAWCSGETLAAAAGISRAALAKRIAHLRDWGLDVETQPGLGYRLQSPLSRLDAEQIRSALAPYTQAYLRQLDVVLRTDSTNQRLLEAGHAADPQMLFAEMQSAGRGRRGRVWRSPFGANLYGSLAWSFPAWPPQLGTLPLAVGVACARAIRTLGIDDVRLKWPNDLRVGAAKLGGILIEQRGEAGGACRVVIGIGLNISMSAAQAGALDQAWTSLAQACISAGIATPSRNLVASVLIDALIAALLQFEASGFASFLDDWNALDAAAGQAVRVTGGAQEVIEGIACGIDADGALIVDSAGRRRHLHAGDVSLRITGTS
ncbi:MAG: biotin--[acetyl-CoA-carboxylase] ligase [Nevskia sp.]|nr:biotin--[acetyl-CoA-carboxylase] ligase [Nevskia sp.]